MTRRLGFDEYLDAIEADAARLGWVIGDRLAAPVPSCPEWTGRDLTDHVTHVFGFWARQLETGDPEEPRPVDDGPLVPDSEQVAALDAATAALLDALRRAGPDEPCWNWAGEDLVSAWVARRMALEVAVHRFDGELAAGDLTPVPGPLAIDGIDERVNVHLRADVPEDPNATLGGSLCLACTDEEAAFLVEVGGGKVRCREGRGPASAVLRGSASDLFLFSWNRIGVDALELTGERAVAEAWAGLPA